jgi:hypothetical protein
VGTGHAPPARRPEREPGRPTSLSAIIQAAACPGIWPKLANVCPAQLLVMLDRLVYLAGPREPLGRA